VSGSPFVICDDSAKCFHHCCLSSSLCPSSSCVSSLDALDDARANCDNKCLRAVSCVPFNPRCVPHDRQEHCIGTVHCLTAACDSRTEGDICLYDGVSVNFKICQGARLPAPATYCETQITFNADGYYFSLAGLVTALGTQISGMKFSPCTNILPTVAPGGLITYCVDIVADSTVSPVRWESVPTATASTVAVIQGSAYVVATTVQSTVVKCNLPVV